jgi:pyruvate/2-oxoglutarate dehydrogenase complex dihydrolipoamide dehydrogenase (E3) component
MQKSPYDLIVLGGGSAGLTAAVMSAGLGARTLLVERHKLGGDCLHTGCIPSKALIRSANVAALVARASEFGLDIPPPVVDFPRVMERVAGVIRRIEPHDSPESLARRGVEVRFGEARFVSPREIAVNGEMLRSRKFVIATGSRPAIPPLEGLRDYLTNENVFELRKRPEHLLVLGAGPIGVEMAQAFRRLGSRVTLFDLAPRILPREDAEVSVLVASVFEQEGIRIVINAKILRDEVRVSASRTTEHTLTFEQVRAPTVREGAMSQETVSGDALLIAVGRRPDVAGLDLEKAGVAVEEKGIRVNARCRTTARNIYACGDVTGEYLFTHTAEYQAKIAVTNAILHVPLKLDYRAVPWVIFTDPEAASVGLPEEEGRARHAVIKVHRITFEHEDRALTDGETAGLVKVIATPRGKILGAHIVGSRAGEMILEYTLAMQHGLRLPQISSTVHPYPTFGLAGRHAADLYWREKANKTLVRWLQRIFGYSGTISDPKSEP